jgi:putative membrane protein
MGFQFAGEERNTMRLLLRWLITAVALVAATFVPGIAITDQNGWFAVLVMAAIFGLVNAFIRPILTLLSCPLILLTLGLFTLVINAVCLWLSAWIATNWFGAGFAVNGFFPAILGGIVVSIVSFLLSMFLPDENEQGRGSVRRA